MTPDELFTRIHKLHCELIAVKTAQEALMIALPAELQEQWLQALGNLHELRGDTLLELRKHGGDAISLEAQRDALASRFVALEVARRFSRGDAASL